MGLFTYDMNLGHIPEPPLGAAGGGDKTGGDKTGGDKTGGSAMHQQEEQEEEEGDEMQLDALWQVWCGCTVAGVCTSMVWMGVSELIILTHPVHIHFPGHTFSGV